MDEEKAVEEKAEEPAAPEPEGTKCIFCNRQKKMNQVSSNILMDKVNALNETGEAVRYVQMAHDYLAEVQMRELLTLAAFVYDIEKADKGDLKKAADEVSSKDKKIYAPSKDGTGELG